MTRHTLLKVAACSLAGIVVVLWPGCSPSGFPVGGGTGNVRLSITDGPFPFEFVQEALVTITRVEARRSHAGEMDANVNGTDDQNANMAESERANPGAGDDPGAAGEAGSNQAEDAEANGNANSAGASGRPWVVLFDDPAGKSFNLLDLRNGQADLLADAMVPAGTYTQMRLVVMSGQITLTDGRMFPLDVPSGDRTGIKLNFTFDVLDGQQTELLLDVDLSRAFRPVPAGQVADVTVIQEFQFSPAVAMRLINVVSGGNVTGMVMDADGNPVANTAVTAFAGDTEVTSTSTDADGTYALAGLPAGTYRLEFSAAGFDTTSLMDVAVQGGRTTSGVNATLMTAAVAQP
ncbi:MAG TPA: DUF4382 domain-containing protein [Phycisphaerae bacterium]